MKNFTYFLSFFVTWLIKNNTPTRTGIAMNGQDMMPVTEFRLSLIFMTENVVRRKMLFSASIG